MKEYIDILLKSLPVIITVFFNAFIVIATIYVVYRSGSTAVFANKLWGLLIGEKQYYNEALAKREQNEHDVAKFNFKTNLKVKSIEQIEYLYKSLEKYDLDISLFRGLKNCYIPCTAKVKRVSKLEIFNIYIVSMLIGCFLLPLFIGIFIFKPVSTFNGDQLFDLFAYTLLASLSTIFSFSELFRKIKANRTRKTLYIKKIAYRRNRKP